MNEYDNMYMVPSVIYLLEMEVEIDICCTQTFKNILLTSSEIQPIDISAVYFISISIFISRGEDMHHSSDSIKILQYFIWVEKYTKVKTDQLNKRRCYSLNIFNVINLPLKMLLSCVK